MIKRSARLYFAKLKLSDVRDYHRLTGNFAVMEQIIGGIYTLEESQREVDRLVHSLNHHPYGGIWTARLSSNHQFIGVGALIPIGEGIVDLGYRILEEEWEKGFGLEIGQSLIRYAQQHPNIQKIIASTAAENVASQKILEKIGLQFKSETISEDGVVAVNYEWTTFNILV